MRYTITTTIYPKRYKVIIESGIARKPLVPDGTIIITDRVVAKYHAGLLRKFSHLVIPSGEKYKRIETVAWLAENLAQIGANRNSTLLALGGGVMTDLTGFLASLYMRGIQYYSLPTTLLAMVDASIGGKTGVDLDTGKNLLGTFYPPQAVFLDPVLLETLPAKQFAYGMAEVIKHGMLDVTLFKWLEKNVAKIQARDLSTLQQLLQRNLQVKRAIVQADEREHETRMLLNLGHSFGHAIEQLSKYSIAHGEAVGLGLIYAAQFANFPDFERLITLLHAFGLPTQLEQPFSPQQMVDAMRTDKKNRNHNFTLVLPKQLGEVEIHYDITAQQLVKFFRVVQDETR